MEINDGFDLDTRVNTIDGMTDEDVRKWGWRVTEKGWVNYPDYQVEYFVIIKNKWTDHT